MLGLVYRCCIPDQERRFEIGGEVQMSRSSRKVMVALRIARALTQCRPKCRLTGPASGACPRCAGPDRARLSSGACFRHRVLRARSASSPISVLFPPTRFGGHSARPLFSPLLASHPPWHGLCAHFGCGMAVANCPGRRLRSRPLDRVRAGGWLFKKGG